MTKTEKCEASIENTRDCLKFAIKQNEITVYKISLTRVKPLVTQR